MRFSDSEIERIKADNPCHKLAAETVRLRRTGDHYAGPCPLCSRDVQSKSAGRFEAWDHKWVCAACCDGGDVIALYAKLSNLDAKRDFSQILARLGGSADSTAAETPITAKRAGARAFAQGKPSDTPHPFAGTPLAADWQAGWRAEYDRKASTERYRERERKRLFDNFWSKAAPWRGTPVERYLLEARKLLVPSNARVRFFADMPYFRDGREKEPEVLHSGPSMLAAIFGPDPLASAETLARGSGYRFAGLHITYIDLTKPKGKLIISDPESGDALPAKKVRGTKQGGYIDLGGCCADQASTMIAGEGIENALRGYSALVRAGRDLSAVNIRCAIDRGNIGGKALDRVPHPTETDARGRAKRVPGTAPDLESAIMPVPSGIRLLTWMCDGDSDPTVTRNAMKRAEQRHARPGLKQNFLWPHGRDWNDVA